mmetsp:Transcript_23467/g.30487  ORF Transcript_23467/g.30487 Transcript_23467/m.30487 type:complete len:532 (+) Transcript_23467:3-1598(+)
MKLVQRFLILCCLISTIFGEERVKEEGTNSVCDCTDEVLGLREEIEKIKAVGKRNDMEIADLERALSASKEENVIRSAELEKISQSAENERKRFESSAEEIKSLKAEKNNLISQKSDLSGQLGKVRKEIQVLTESVNQEREEKNSLMTALAETEESCQANTQNFIYIKDGTIAINGTKTVLAAVNRVRIITEIVLVFATAATKSASAKTREFYAIVSSKSESVRVLHLAPAYSVAKNVTSKNYKIVAQFVQNKYQIIALASKKQYQIAKTATVNGMIKTDALIKQQLIEKNLTKILEMYDTSTVAVTDLFQNKMPTVVNKTKMLALDLYQALTPTMQTASNLTTSITTEAIVKISNIYLTASTSLTNFFHQLPDLTVQKLIAARDTLVLRLGFDVRYANALVAAICAGIAVILFFIGLASLRVLFSWLLTLIFAILVFTKALLAFILYKTPIYTVTDLLPACFILVFKLILVYPLKLLFSPITVPIIFIRRALSSSRGETEKKAQPSTTQRQGQKSNQNIQQQHAKKKKNT